MWKRHLGFSVSFGIVALVNLIPELFTGIDIRIFVKPLICILLFTYLASSTKLYGNFRKLVFAGLVFSFLGDCILIFSSRGQYYFIGGLVSFLIAHVFYSIAFFRDFKNDPTAPKIYGHIMLFVMGIFTLSFYLWLRPYLADLRYPVLAYMFIISVMAILAGYRYQRVNHFSFQTIIIGAIFFIISDASLAYDKFVFPGSGMGFLIMSTYMLAQYLITIGTIERQVAGRREAY